MSSDLIKRSDVLKALKDSVVEMGGDDFCEMGVHIDDIDAVVNAIPSADLNAEFAEWAKLWFKKELDADRPQGEWIRTERMGTFKLYDCSVCGIHIEAPWNFCPNCGARMKGADDE